MIKYEEFLDRKTQVGCDHGFEPLGCECGRMSHDVNAKIRGKDTE
jgi:hypothetical protein